MNALLVSTWPSSRCVAHITRRFRSSSGAPPPFVSILSQDAKPPLYPNRSQVGFPKGEEIQFLREDLQTQPPNKDGKPYPAKTRAGNGAYVAKLASSKTKRNYQMFRKLVDVRFRSLLFRMGPWEQKKVDFGPFGIQSERELGREASLFNMALKQSFDLAVKRGLTSRESNPLFWNLRKAFTQSDAKGLARELKYGFQTFLQRSRIPKAVTDMHLEVADQRFPYDFYPEARMMQRTLHLHVGPTNSGKTYNALLALEKAKTGVYAGPLRLLAHEIYSRFNAKGRACALLTGEEQRIPEDGNRNFSSCTVEMSPLSSKIDVAVVDEIQMMADPVRGWAWTQAIIGLQAKELHLCGEDRVVPLILAMAARMGDECIVHRYERLNPLLVMDGSLKGDLERLEKGDAIVGFSRVVLHQLKAGIEKATGRRCAIVYGALPPETRAQQAALFNDPNNDYDFLVASDAIGMGLNLEIKRVVFESSTKFDGITWRNLDVPEFKQIGGRAGRFSTASRDMASCSDANSETSSPAAPAAAAADRQAPSPGLVTTLDQEDLPLVQKAFKSEPLPITSAGILPPNHIIEQFCSHFPTDTPFSFVLSRLREMASLTDQFHLCDLTPAIEIAEAIQTFPMSVADRCVFLKAPVNTNDASTVKALKAFARCVAECEGGKLHDISAIDLEVLDIDADVARHMPDYLQRLESLHKAITLYLWLTYRFQGIFQSQAVAFHAKSLVEAKITEYFDGLSFTAEARRKRRQAMRIKAMKEQEKAELMSLEGEQQPGEVGVDGGADG